MFGAMFRDKDGVAGAAVFAEMAADLYARGETVSRRKGPKIQLIRVFVILRCHLN